MREHLGYVSRLYSFLSGVPHEVIPKNRTTAGIFVICFDHIVGIKIRR